MFEEINENQNFIFDFFNIQNITFNHPLSIEEIESFKQIIFNYNNLNQIYFKDEIDIDSIETIKNLLMLGNFVDDKKIEKIVIKDLNDTERNRLINGVYLNPDTWEIPYESKNKDYSLGTIPKCRSLNTYIGRIKKAIKEEKLSESEIIIRVYDIVKSLDMDENFKDVLDIISNNKSSKKGYNIIYNYILKELGIKSYVGTIKTEEGQGNITVIYIDDKKYSIEGLYVFNPLYDYIMLYK